MTKTITFTKMHALGNDFMLIDNIRYPYNWTPRMIAKLARRHKGVGFDQLLCAEPPTDKTADFFMRIYNADGSEANQCGNGIRCFYSFVRAQQLSQKSKLSIQTASRTLSVEQGDSQNQVHCNMGRADFSWQGILQPRLAKKQPTAKKPPPFMLELDDTELTVYLVSFGNPHCIIKVDNAKAGRQLLDRYGEAIAQHPAFVAGINIGCAFLSGDKLVLHTYERGVGPTLACGSNICAATAVAQTHWQAAKQLTVQSPGGSAQVWRSSNGSFYLSSRIHHIYNGVL